MSFPRKFDSNERLSIKETTGNLIGEGNFSKVYYQQDVASGIELAVKVFDWKKAERLRKLNDITMERHALLRLNHSSIVKIYATGTKVNRACIFTEFCGGGELWNSCRRVGEPEIRAKVYFKQILNAVGYMHRMGIVHRDLKAENVFVSSNSQNVKLGDFGSSRDLYNPSVKGSGNNSSSSNRSSMSFEHYVGSPNFLSPEAIENIENDEISDIWSLGCLFYQVLVGLAPFVAGSEYLVYLRVRARDLHFPPGLSGSARNLVDSILRLNRFERPLLSMIESHAFFVDTAKHVSPLTETDHVVRKIAFDESIELSANFIESYASLSTVRDRLKHVAVVREWERLSRPGSGTQILDHLDLGLGKSNSSSETDS